MRLRYDKKSEEILLENPELVVINPQENKLWDKIKKPIHLEIGMGKGQFIIRLAKTNPEVYFIGLEKEKSVLSKAIRKLKREKTQINNLLFVLASAKEIDQIFRENQIDHLYLNFSDPWPKKRHAKRRLTDDVSLNMYQRILKKDGLIEFKTDNRGLFTFSLLTFVEKAWPIVELSLNLHEDKEDIITTEYEDRFIEKQKTIYYLKVQNAKNEII